MIDAWQHIDRIRGERDALALAIRKVRNELRADRDKFSSPKPYHVLRQLVNQGQLAHVAEFKRHTPPLDRHRLLRLAERLLDYAASPFDDRGMCGYGDYLAELRHDARQFAILCLELAPEV